MKRLSAMKAAVGLTCLICAGCLVLDPGGQAARSLKQRSVVIWDAEGNLTVKTRGPQTASWEMASKHPDSDGEILLMKDKDGNTVLDPRSTPDYWFRSYPSAEAAAGVAPTFVEGSVAQSQLLGQVITALAPHLRPQPEPEPTPTEGEGEGE